MYFVPLESENKCVQHVKAGCWYIMLSHLFGNKSWHHPWLHAVSDDITVHTTSLGFLIWLECNLRRENSLECVLNYDDVYARLEITLYSLRLKTANEPMVSPKGAGPWLALRPWIDTGLLALDWQWDPGLTQGCWPLTGSEPLDWHRAAGPWLAVSPWIDTGLLALDCQWAPGLTQGCWPLTGSESLDWHRAAGPWLAVSPWIDTGVLVLCCQWFPGSIQGYWLLGTNPASPPPDPHRGAGPWLQMNPQINKKGKENCSKNILCENILLLT